VLCEDVIRCDAGLSGIEQLDPGDAPRGDIDVRIGGHDHGTLAAEFQGRRCQCRGSGGHDLAADFRATSEQRVVEALSEQLLGHRRVALDHADGFGINVFRQ
jgi:hypothetical protein